MKNENKRDDSRLILAIVLIVVGVIWALRRMGLDFEISELFWNNFYHPFREFITGSYRIFFSWPMIFIIVGVVLLAGKRSFGMVLLIVGGIFLVSRIFDISGMTASLLLPVALVVFGITMIVRSL